MHLLFNVGTGIFAIHRNFKDAPKYVSECASNSAEPAVLKACQDGANLWKGVMIGIFVLAWLLELCQSLFHLRFSPCSSHVVISGACSIVNKYRKQLTEESLGMVKNTETW